MLNKIKLYLKVLNKGEIFKRIEYKIKDLIGYFYIRNKLTKVKEQYQLNIPVVQIVNNKYNSDDKYYIFNKCIDYFDIKKELIYTKEFWRKCNISKYDDVKKVWETNRLQFLLSMAMKYNITKNDKYKKLIIDILDYWSEKNKFEYSINWNNNLEVAVRAISILITLTILNDNELNKKYSQLIYLHAKYLYNEINYSKVCIPNNHLIGETIALLVLSKVLIVKENKKWERRALNILRKYNDIISEDGVSIENSFSYQFFVTKMYILALSFIDDKELFNIINRKILKSLEFLRFTIINSEKVINYGDNDNAFFFSIEDKYNLSKDITRYYNYFFKNEKDDETQVIDELLKHNKKELIKGEIQNNDYFVNKNIFIYNKDNIVLFFNAKNISGHSHNDSLSIVLAVDGEEVLFDSGTYSYNLDKEKRKYYTSREAHNTILFEKENAKRVGTFRWYNLYNSYIENIYSDKTFISIQGVIEKICKRNIKISFKNNIAIIDIFDESLDESTLIKNNWLVNNSIEKDNKISYKCTNFMFDNSISKVDSVEVSESYLCKNKKSRYQTKYQNNIGTKINIERRKYNV